MYAAHATAAVSPSWLQPSALRARLARATTDPALLPNPRPIRNTARMIEKVYTDAPSISDSNRVQTTSAPSADNPDNAIATYTRFNRHLRIGCAHASRAVCTAQRLGARFDSA